MASYKTTVGLDNDKTGKRFEIGDTVQDGDFSAKIIALWVKAGVLIKQQDEVNDGGDTERER